MRQVLYSFLLLQSMWALANSPNSDLQRATQLLEHDIEQAEFHIEKALKIDKANPEVHYFCGRIMGKLASERIFSALSYAKKSLACFKQAVVLQPNNISYRNGLISFYLGAPKIAGGDHELAWQQVELISKLNSLEGTTAKLLFFRKTEQTEQYQSLLQKSVKQYPQQAQFHYRYGLLLQEQHHYRNAVAAFQAATTAANDDNDIYRLNAWYQIGRTAVFSEQQIDLGIEALTVYLNQATVSSELPDKFWAHFRLAQLHKLMGNTNLMQTHLAQASQNNDKELHREIRRLQR